MTDPITITVKNTAGTRFEMTISDLSETVAQFKQRLETPTSIPANSQRLIFRGHILKDHLTFANIKDAHGLDSGQSMHVVPALSSNRSNTSTSAAATPPSSTAPSTGPAANSPAANNNPAAAGAPPPAGGANPFAAAFGGMPMGDLMEMQNQMMHNPEQMQAMLNSPIMESIMNNPEIARTLVMSNPQIRELIERNPEVAHMFNDPATFRQIIQTARNPSLMNEMMRNTDRQMANIEMMPGGFDALRRMHENIQAPLMDAAAQGNFGQNGDGANNNNPSTNGTNAAAGTDSDNPFSSLFRSQNTPSNAPMPNPWAPNNGAPTPANNAAPRNAPANSPLPSLASLFPPAAAGTGTDNGNGPSTTGANPSPFPSDAQSDQMLRMLENPMMLQMMEHMIAVPELMQSMIDSNPQLQAMMQSNPEFGRLLRNPELMRTFLNPEVIRAARVMQDAMRNSGADLSALGGLAGNPTATAPAATAPGTTAPGATATGTAPSTTATNPPSGTNTAAANPFMQMFAAPPGGNGAATGTGTNGGNGANGGRPDQWPGSQWMTEMLQALNTANGGAGVPGAPGAQATPAREPTQGELEEMYSSQLAQLRDMGFLDTSMCLQALRQSQGNVSAAIENLLNRFGGS